ncbi:hypothetical protein MC885_020992 [Smutsia gigantea]|nr:hypothetical protein MC885_020992 [Smutsia gigantea]
MAARGCSLEAVPLPADVREGLAELELELSEGDITQKGYEKKRAKLLARHMPLTQGVQLGQAQGSFSLSTGPELPHEGSSFTAVVQAPASCPLSSHMSSWCVVTDSQQCGSCVVSQPASEATVSLLHTVSVGTVPGKVTLAMSDSGNVHDANTLSKTPWRACPGRVQCCRGSVEPTLQPEARTPGPSQTSAAAPKLQKSRPTTSRDERFRSDVHTEAVQAALAKYKERKMPMPSKRCSVLVHPSVDTCTPPGTDEQCPRFPSSRNSFLAVVKIREAGD